VINHLKPRRKRLGKTIEKRSKQTDMGKHKGRCIPGGRKSIIFLDVSQALPAGTELKLEAETRNFDFLIK
jgi:hypothetical protein